jgi:hypothetical protein
MAVRGDRKRATRVLAEDLVAGDKLVFRGEENRSIKEVVKFGRSTHASTKIYALFVNKEKDGLTMKTFRPTQEVLVIPNKKMARQQPKANAAK